MTRRSPTPLKDFADSISSLPVTLRLGVFTVVGLGYLFARRSGMSPDFDAAFFIVGGFALKFAARSLFLRLPRRLAFVYLVVEGLAIASYMVFVDSLGAPAVVPAAVRHGAFGIVGLVLCLALLVDAVACAAGAEYGAPKRWE